jgi:DNA-binding MarR family transcriptional regulator
MTDASRRALARELTNILPSFGHWASGIRDFDTPYGRLGTRQVAILWLIRHEVIPADRLSPTRIAEYHHIQPSVVTRALAKLEEGGFVERSMDSIDRRRTHLEITEKGREASEYVEELYVHEMLAGMQDLDDSQVADLERSLGALAQIADVLKERGLEDRLSEDDPEG